MHSSSSFYIFKWSSETCLGGDIAGRDIEVLLQEMKKQQKCCIITEGIHFEAQYKQYSLLLFIV